MAARVCVCLYAAEWRMRNRRESESSEKKEKKSKEKKKKSELYKSKSKSTKSQVQHIAVTVSCTHISTCCTMWIYAIVTQFIIAPRIYCALSFFSLFLFVILFYSFCNEFVLSSCGLFVYAFNGWLCVSEGNKCRERQVENNYDWLCGTRQFCDYDKQQPSPPPSSSAEAFSKTMSVPHSNSI